MVKRKALLVLFMLLLLTFNTICTMGSENELPDNLKTIYDELGDVGYEQFTIACNSINLDYNEIRNFTQIDDWASGKRYRFYYGNNENIILYMFDSGYVDGIKVWNVNVYKDGEEPLDIEDFLISPELMGNLQGSAEAVIKETLTRPETANFDWWTTGNEIRIQDYFILEADCSAKNGLGDKQTFSFRTDFRLEESTLSLVYCTIDGDIYYGSENIPEIERDKTESAIQASSENGIVLIEGQTGEYGVEDEWGILYYLPAGAYDVTSQNRGGLYVCNPDDDETYDSIMFENVGDTGTIEVPEGYYIELIIGTSVELIPR